MTGVLLVNLGTPDSPATSDVRKYLREFLSDPRVIDINPIARWALVNLIIAPLRAPKSAKLYKQIWTDNGSPLLVHSLEVKNSLQKKLGENFKVELAMRYQSPGLKDVIEKFKTPVYNKIIVLPLFPQYASASTGSVYQKVMEITKQWQVTPSIEFINSYHNYPSFIDAWHQVTAAYDPNNYDHVLFSFHGLPERQIKKADCLNHCLKNNCCDSLNKNNLFCYRAQCFDTARLIAAKMNLSYKNYTVCFQSRLGKDPWIKPYSDIIIKERAALGDKKLLVLAPAFVSDCLETIYEIGVEYDLLFKENGGEKIQLVPSLNNHPAWIEALSQMCFRNAS